MLTSEQKHQIEVSVSKGTRAALERRREERALMHNERLKQLIAHLYDKENLEDLLEKPIADQLKDLSRLAHDGYELSADLDYASDLAIDR